VIDKYGVVSSSTYSNEGRLSKIVFLLILREGSKLNDYLSHIIKQILDNDNTTLILKLFTIKALVMRGDQLGFTRLVQLIQNKDYS
jgi:hypothetical protein